MKIPDNIKRDSAKYNIASFIIPFLAKWLIVLPQRAYVFCFSVSFVLALFLFLMRKKITNHTPLKVLGSLALASGLCIVLYPEIQFSPKNDWLEYKLDKNYLVKTEKKANQGDVDAMEKLGTYYAYTTAKTLIQSESKNVIREDELFPQINFNKASRYFEMAAKENSPYAFTQLGRMKIEGLGCIPSRVRGIQEFRNLLGDQGNKKTVEEQIQRYGISYEEFPDGYAFLSRE